MHREDFERRVKRFGNSGAYTEIRQDDVEARKRRWIVQIDRRPPLIRWGALIGECLFNFRSALDHLVYDLAVANKGHPLPARVEENVEFPIFTKRAPDSEELHKRIGTLKPGAQRLIERMQPYGRKNRAALKYLHELQNFDKHRTLHLVVAVTTTVTYFGDLEFDFLNVGPLKHDDILAEAPIAGDSESQQNPKFSYGVAFSEAGPGAKARDVVQTLDLIGRHIERHVIPPLLTFL